jgi:hypothetical protein
MSNAVKSARGQLVDFDHLKIKQQLATAPKPTNVKAREDFIDQKFKRRLKKISRTIVDTAGPGDDFVDEDETPEESL